jgi:hypothetical protein
MTQLGVHKQEFATSFKLDVPMLLAHGYLVAQANLEIASETFQLEVIDITYQICFELEVRCTCVHNLAVCQQRGEGDPH